MSRIFHDTYGHGVCLSEELSESGHSIARCVFDANPKTERVILAAFLDPSDKPVARAMTKAKTRKTTRATAEKISDRLLVPAMEDKYAPDDLTEES